MSVIKRLSQLFSSPESKDVLGLSIRQQSLAYTVIGDDKSIQCKKIDFPPEQCASELASLSSKHSLEGQC